jgi:hypothetical protein
MISEKVDSTKETGKYLGLDVTISKGHYENELLRLFKGAYTIVNTGNHYNVNTKIFGYGGYYKVSGLEEYDGRKAVFGIGGEFGTSFNLKIESFKMGLGLSAGLTSEFGGYDTFRKMAEREGKIHSEHKFINLFFSAFPVISCELSNSTVLSTQANLGFPGFISPSVLLNNDGNVYWISWIPNEIDGDEILGYRFVLGFMMSINNF